MFHCEKFIFGFSGESPLVFLIGESPKVDVFNNFKFGKGITKLIEFFSKEGLLPYIYFDNLFKCQDQTDCDLNMFETECLSLIKEQIKKIDPKLIVLYGSKVKKILLPGFRKINSLSKLKIDGKIYPCLPTIHFSAAFYNRELQPILNRTNEIIKEFIIKNNKKL